MCPPPSPRCLSPEYSPSSPGHAASDGLRQKRRAMSRIVRHRPDEEQTALSSPSQQNETSPPGVDHIMWHSKMVTQLCALPSRERMITACADGRLRMYSTVTGELLETMVGHSRSVFALCALDGDIVVSGGDDHTLRVWDTSVANCIFSSALRGFVKSVAALAPGRFVAGVGFDLVFFEYTRREIWGWNGNTQTVRVRENDRLRNAHIGFIYDIAVHGRRFVTASYDKTATVWEHGSHEPVTRLSGHSRCVNCVALNDRYIVTGASDHTLRIYSARSFNCILVLDTVHTSNIYAVVAVDDNNIVSFSLDKTVCVIRLPRGAVAKRLSLPFRCRTGILLPDGRIAAAGGGSSSGHAFLMPAPPLPPSPPPIALPAPVLPSFTGTMPPSGSYLGRGIPVRTTIPRGVPHSVMPLMAVARRAMSFIDGTDEGPDNADVPETAPISIPTPDGDGDRDSERQGAIASADSTGGGAFENSRPQAESVRRAIPASEGEEQSMLTQAMEESRYLYDHEPDSSGREEEGRPSLETADASTGEVGHADDRQCCVCMAASFSGCLVPCGHCQFCFSCATELHERVGRCPFCRTDISSVMQIYM